MPGMVRCDSELDGWLGCGQVADRYAELRCWSRCDMLDPVASVQSGLLMFHLIDGKVPQSSTTSRAVLARHRCDHCRYRASIASDHRSGCRGSVSRCPMQFGMPIAEAATGGAGGNGSGRRMSPC